MHRAAIDVTGVWVFDSRYERIASPTPPNRTSSPFRVHAPGPPSSIVCIRLPAPAGFTRPGFHKSRNWRLGIGPTGVEPPAVVDVERHRSGLAAPCRLHSTADPPRWFLPERTRRQRVSRVYRRKAGSPAQTSQPQPEAQPSRPAPRLQTVSVSKRDLDPDSPHCFKPLRPLKASRAEPHRSVASARHPGPDTPHPRSRPSASRTSGPRRRSRVLHPRSRSREHHSPRLVCSMGLRSTHRHRNSHRAMRSSDRAGCRILRAEW